MRQINLYAFRQSRKFWYLLIAAALDPAAHCCIAQIQNRLLTSMCTKFAPEDKSDCKDENGSCGCDSRRYVSSNLLCPPELTNLTETFTACGKMFEPGTNLLER